MSSRMRGAKREDSTSEARADVVLTRAFTRAGEKLALQQQDLVKIIHASRSTVSRIHSGQALLSPGTAEGQLALLFLRIFRSLDTVVGGDSAKAAEWFKSENAHLGERPLVLAQSPQGLVHVAEYLDAMRGRL